MIQGLGNLNDPDEW